MTEKEMEVLLQELFQSSEMLEEAGISLECINSYEEAGIMTMDKGLVVEIIGEDGNRNEFQIRIVRSR